MLSLRRFSTEHCIVWISETVDPRDMVWIDEVQMARDLKEFRAP